MTPERPGARPEPAGVLSSRARAGWTLADQVVVSVRNFALLWVVISTTSAASVGAFGIVYTAYFLAMAVVRGFAGDPLIVRFSDSPEGDFARGVSSSLAVVVGLSLLGALLLAVPLAFSRSQLWVGLSVLGCALFALLAQDHLRLAMFARARPDRATTNDLGVLAVLAVALVVLWRDDAVSITTVVVAWGMASLVGALAAVRRLHVPFSASGARAWLGEHVDLGPAFAADALANRGTEQLANVAVTTVASLAALGAITTSRTLFAPLTTVQTGVNAFMMPEVSRRAGRGDLAGLRPLVHTISLALGAIMVVTGLVLLVVPDALGSRVFSSNWGPASHLIVPMTVFSALNAVGFGYWAALKALARAKRTLLVRASGGLAGVVAATMGATSGAAGATWGMAFGALVTALWLGWEFHHELLNRESVHIASA